MRVAILRSNGYIDQKIQRLLDQLQVKGDVVDRITRREIELYDFFIASHHNKVPNMPVLLERLVLEQKIQVIYITNTPSIGQFHAVYHDKFFHIVEESTLEIEVNVLFRVIGKYMNEITHLQQSLVSTKEQLATIKETNKAKRILMENGYTEPQAHQYIQQKSMAMRVSKKRLVNLIIENKIDF